jgi:pimeloyl-ACP methyl ester carboxylesterase
MEVWAGMRRFRIRIRDGELAGVAFGDPVRPVEVMFLHATGFNALTYESIFEPLGAQAHCAAIDFRGHGRSTAPAHPRRLRSWNRFRDDTIQALEQVSPGGAVLGGHSMGATVALLVAAKRPDLVKALVLVDPVLLRPGRYQLLHMPFIGRLFAASPISRQALRRRRRFESPADAVEQLRGRGAFATWRPPFLEDYVVDGILRSDAGTYELACTPEWESAVFAAQRNQPWSAVKRLRRRRIPLIVLQAERNSTALADTDRRIHAVRPDAAVTRVPGTTHFIPMERPYVVRDAFRLLFEATLEGGSGLDYVGAVRRTIDDSIGFMS